MTYQEYKAQLEKEANEDRIKMLVLNSLHQDTREDIEDLLTCVDFNTSDLSEGYDKAVMNSFDLHCHTATDMASIWTLSEINIALTDYEMSRRPKCNDTLENDNTEIDLDSDTACTGIFIPVK